MASEGGLFIEVDHVQLPCHGENLAGDVVLARKLDGERRVLSVLADGLSSGVEAAVLASVTASMALEYVLWHIDTERACALLLDSLPVEPVRAISYSTFTVVDACTDGHIRVFEHGNPPFLLMRDGVAVEVPRRTVQCGRWGKRALQVSEFVAREGDRIVCFSDGVTQSGMGSEEMPLGWGELRGQAWLERRMAQHPDISARRLCDLVVESALANDGGEAGDDISCAVIAFRQPRRLSVITGPPYEASRDGEFARLVEVPGARKVICGGTTSNIIARELRRDVAMDLSSHDRDVPVCSYMAGVELVTEGCLTLGRLAEYLEAGGGPPGRTNAATRLMELLLDSDIIDFQVGTRVNEAHQDPSLPVELDIRRNVIKRLAGLLEERYLKKTHITYF